MMGIARLTTADQAGLLGDKLHMLAIANAPRLGMRQHRLVNRWRRWRRGLSFLATSICGAGALCLVFGFRAAFASRRSRHTCYRRIYLLVATIGSALGRI